MSIFIHRKPVFLLKSDKLSLLQTQKWLLIAPIWMGIAPEPLVIAPKLITIAPIPILLHFPDKKRHNKLLFSLTAPLSVTGC